MTGMAKEIEKNMLFATDWQGPFRQAKKVKKGKVQMIITLEGGEHVTLGSDQAVRFVTLGVDPWPDCLERSSHE